MAKNKKQPHLQLLSPENYIRQKARNLPVFECHLNSNWKEMGSATIVFSRIHANGNLTFAMYMVDLLCLGVRDTHYRFNTTQDDHEDLLDMMSENFEMQKVEYTLVHNIIFSALEYADENGFKPHKDFSSITKYMLEEDTEDIEFIEIECGRNGKPFFVKTEEMSEKEANKIINQLEKTVGKGNFEILLIDDDDEMGIEEDEIDAEHNDDWGVDDEFDSLEYDKKIELFRELTANDIDDLDVEDKKRLILLTDSIYFMNICDDDEVDGYIDSWQPETMITTTDEEYTAELLSQKSDFKISEHDSIELDEIDFLTDDNPAKAFKHIAKLKKKWGNIPYLSYKELKFYQLNDPKEYDKKVNGLIAEFPNYPLLRLQKYKYEVLNSTSPEDFDLIDFQQIFDGRKSVTQQELFEFQSIKMISIMARSNVNELEAFYEVVDTVDLNEDFHAYIKTMLILTRIRLLEEKYAKSDIFQFKIQLKDVNNPPVWRKLQVSSNCTFYKFHTIIQYAFGWKFSHLYCFSPKGFGSSPMIESYPEDDVYFEKLEDESLDATQTILSDIFNKEKQKFTYIYDFGDSWTHEIVLEKIHKDEVLNKPLLMSGVGACPPEDCGGSWGYESLKETLADKKHSEHKSMKEWLGMSPKEKWDATDFDIDMNQRLINQYC